MWRGGGADFTIHKQKKANSPIGSESYSNLHYSAYFVHFQMHTIFYKVCVCLGGGRCLQIQIYIFLKKSLLPLPTPPPPRYMPAADYYHFHFIGTFRTTLITATNQWMMHGFHQWLSLWSWGGYYNRRSCQNRLCRCALIVKTFIYYFHLNNIMLSLMIYAGMKEATLEKKYITRVVIFTSFF